MKSETPESRLLSRIGRKRGDPRSDRTIADIERRGSGNRQSRRARPGHSMSPAVTASESVRAMAAAKRANLGVAQRKSNIEKSISQREAAIQFGVSLGSVQNAAAVLRHGSPELIDAVESGDIAVSLAAKTVRRTQQTSEEIIRAPQKGDKPVPPRQPLTSLPIRWTARRKAKLIEVILAGVLSREAACARHELSPEELALWEKRYAAHGWKGLRATHKEQQS
jgi:hypothetical protein